MGKWGIEWSRGRWRHVTPKGQVVTPVCLEPNILKNSWICYLFSNNRWLLDRLLWDSTVGYLSGSSASCCRPNYFRYRMRTLWLWSLVYWHLHWIFWHVRWTTEAIHLRDWTTSNGTRSVFILASCLSLCLFCYNNTIHKYGLFLRAMSHYRHYGSSHHFTQSIKQEAQLSLRNHASAARYTAG